MTISCQPDGCLPQPVRPWKSGHVHLAEGSNVVVLDLPYSTEFGRDSREFASMVLKYGKFSHFLTHLVVYGGQGKKQILSSLSTGTANVYRLSPVKVSGTCVQPFQRYWGVWGFWSFGVFWGGLWVFCVFGVFGDFGVFGVLGCFGVLGVLGCFGVF